MACVEYSCHHHEDCVVLTKAEAQHFLPLVEKAIDKARASVDKYQDRHDSGYATDRDETLLNKYESQLENLLSIHRVIQGFLK